ncbi:MAG: hypothetical protein WBI14_03660 [Anaerolineaceae bacterium]
MKTVLITLGVMAVVYGVYLLFGRPAIPLPTYRMQIGPENQLYTLVKATESDEMKLTLITNGHIEAVADENSIAAIDYTPKSMQNTLDLAEKYMAPPDPQSAVDKITRQLPMPLVQALYHTIRLKLTVIITAN